LICLEGAHLENDVMVVVNCYDVVTPTPNCCKNDISERSGVEKFVRIYILELHFVRRVEIAHYSTTQYQTQQYNTMNYITIG
jgi:hypothetical protein